MKTRYNASSTIIKNKKTSPQNGKTQKDSSDSSFEGCQILVVEDNIINQKVIRLLLEDLGCVVSLAEDGNEALQKAEAYADQLDLIFMDNELPGELDGVAVTKQLLQKDKTKDIPIVALTAHFIPEEHDRYLKAGMKRVLIKPISDTVLKEVLLEYICFA